MKRSWVSCLLAGAAISVALPASATVVSLSSITGTWLNPAPLSSIDGYVTNGTGNAKVAWGGNGAASVGLNGGDSGYGFNASANPSANVPPSPSPNFVLGTFTHFNQPIFGNSITGIDLRVRGDVKVGSIDQGFQTFLFHFMHTETPNGDSPCADGGTVGVGVDVNGCADHVVVSNTMLSDTFLVGSDLYTLNIVGFQQASGVTNDFWTKEQANDNAQLLANVTLASTVPEPNTFALASLAIACIGFIGSKSRRRR